MIRFNDLGNYRGDLHIKDVGDKYFWAVECDLLDEKDWRWEEISKELFIALNAHNTAKGKRDE